MKNKKQNQPVKVNNIKWPNQNQYNSLVNRMIKPGVFVKKMPSGKEKK